MARVLIVEDEATLRASWLRGIGRMEGVQVFGAADVKEACQRLDETPVDLVISDIDLPDRPGIELLGELGRRGLPIPIIFVSAYLRAYRAQIPTHAKIDVLEKPVPLEELRRLITARLALAGDEPEPFGVPDYLQLASMGRRSVVLDARFPDGATGNIVVRDGEIWSASIGEERGLECFARIAWDADVRVRCRSLIGNPGPRCLEGSVEALLMDTARQLDERRRDHPSTGRTFTERAQRFSSQPVDDLGFDLDAISTLPQIKNQALAAQASDADDEPEVPHPVSLPVPRGEGATAEERAAAEEEEMFAQHLDMGVRALIDKDLDAAFGAFAAAEALRPGHPTVRANLERLAQMGFGPKAAGDDADGGGHGDGDGDGEDKA